MARLVPVRTFSDRGFAGSVLCGVNFERTNLRRANFSGADLRNANLRNSDLTGAVFDKTDLRGTDFTGANLTDLSFRKSMLGPTTKGFAEALMKVAKPDRSARIPYKWTRAPHRARKGVRPVALGLCGAGCHQADNTANKVANC